MLTRDDCCKGDPFGFAQGRLFLRLKNGFVRMTQSELGSGKSSHNVIATSSAHCVENSRDLYSTRRFSSFPEY
jgi:hypothetical protein